MYYLIINNRSIKNIKVISIQKELKQIREVLSIMKEQKPFYEYKILKELK
jgi:hypothetical protein